MDEKENVPPQSKKRRLSLSMKKNRFKEVREAELQQMSKRIIPQNTSLNTRWGMKNFTDWFRDYNIRNPDSPCPEDLILPCCSAEKLDKWLCVYVAETRSHTGELYPPATLYSLLSGILRHMRQENPSYPNFLNKNCPDFANFTTTLDNVMKNLRSSGAGAVSKHTEGISKEEEDRLWSTETLNVCTPEGLLRAVFYYNGKFFCLRGGQEHRELKLSMLERLKNPDHYLYRENSSKNRKGGLSELRLEHKCVISIANEDAGTKCHVYLLDLYISKLPEEAIKNDLFYCRPLASAAPEGSPWYSAVPIGRNTLGTMVSKMCQLAGISGKTNH